jgi:hypothetical protein
MRIALTPILTFPLQGEGTRSSLQEEVEPPTNLIQAITQLWGAHRV